MRNFLLGLTSELQAGFRPKLCLSILILLGCSSTPKATPQPPESIVFPAEDSEYAVSKLLLEHPYPPESLKRCADELGSITDSIQSEPHLLDAKKQLAPKVITNRVDYHWCFFHLASEMDRQMTNRSLSLEARGEKFLITTQRLWLLARLLDEITVEMGESTAPDMYFSYLLRKYIKISRDVFGRDLKIVAPPLDLRHFPVKPEQGNEKPTD